jgi:hypothetical protein
MNIIIDDIRAQQRYRVTLCGIRYDVEVGRHGGPVEGFRKIGRDEEYDPDVSREEGEDEYDEYSESSSESSSWPCFSGS